MALESRYNERFSIVSGRPAPSVPGGTQRAHGRPNTFNGDVAAAWFRIVSNNDVSRAKNKVAISSNLNASLRKRPMREQTWAVPSDCGTRDSRCLYMNERAGICPIGSGIMPIDFTIGVPQLPRLGRRRGNILITWPQAVQRPRHELMLTRRRWPNPRLCPCASDQDIPTRRRPSSRPWP